MPATDEMRESLLRREQERDNCRDRLAAAMTFLAAAKHVMRNAQALASVAGTIEEIEATAKLVLDMAGVMFRGNALRARLAGAHETAERLATQYAEAIERADKETQAAEPATAEG